MDNNLSAQLNSPKVMKVPTFSGNRLLRLPVSVKGRHEFLDKLLFREPYYLTKDCYFTEMTKDDVPLIEKSYKTWRNKFIGRQLVNIFLCKFAPDKYVPAAGSSKSALPKGRPFFYMLEEAENVSASKKIKGLMYVRPEENDCLYVAYLQSAHPFEKSDKVRGAGTALMYGLSRIAQEFDKKQIKLVPLKKVMPWYSKLGMTFVEDGKLDSHYFLDASDFASFQKKLEAKMKIKRPEFLMTPDLNPEVK